MLRTNDGRLFYDARFVFTRDRIPGIYIDCGYEIVPFVRYNLREGKLFSERCYVDNVKNFSYIRILNYNGMWQKIDPSLLRPFKRIV